MRKNCKGCPWRTPGCHGKCPVYAEWKKSLPSDNEYERYKQERKYDAKLKHWLGRK